MYGCISSSRREKEVFDERSCANSPSLFLLWYYFIIIIIDFIIQWRWWLLLLLLSLYFLRRLFIVRSCLFKFFLRVTFFLFFFFVSLLYNVMLLYKSFLGYTRDAFMYTLPYVHRYYPHIIFLCFLIRDVRHSQAWILIRIKIVKVR